MQGQSEQSVTTSELGAAVLVDGKVVAWFAEFTEEAREWCTENYFGKWLVWRASPPVIIPLTPEELEESQKRANELHKKLFPLEKADD